MRQSFFAFFGFILVATACASPTSNTPTPLANAPTSATTNTRVASNIVTAQPTLQATDVPQPPDQPTTRPTDIPTATPIPSPTRVPAQLIQLLSDTCCASPSWYSDSETILFIDKPNADARTGLYAVRIDEPNKSELWNDRIAFYTREFDYAQIPEQAGTRLIRTRDGKEIRVRNGGRQVQFSPDRTRILWTETRETFPIENRLTNVMLAPIDFDGQGVGEAQRVTQVLRGGASWLDNNRLLMNRRLSRESNESMTYVFDMTTNAETEIFTAERSRLTTVSRNGSWIAYVIVNDKDVARNGLWVERTDGTDEKKVELFGAAQWRDGSRLFIAPFEMNAPTHAFHEYNAETGETRRLTPPSAPFKIASGDWSVSPDGNKIVFVNAADNNLWLWKFSD